MLLLALVAFPRNIQAHLVVKWSRHSLKWRFERVKTSSTTRLKYYEATLQFLHEVKADEKYTCQQKRCLWYLFGVFLCYSGLWKVPWLGMTQISVCSAWQLFTETTQLQKKVREKWHVHWWLQLYSLLHTSGNRYFVVVEFSQVKPSLNVSVKTWVDFGIRCLY